MTRGSPGRTGPPAVLLPNPQGWSQAWEEIGFIPILMQGKLRHGSALGARAAVQSSFWGIKAGNPIFTPNHRARRPREVLQHPIPLHPGFPEPGAELTPGKAEVRDGFWGEQWLRRDIGCRWRWE